MRTTALLVVALMGGPWCAVAGQGASPEGRTINEAAEILRAGERVRLDTTVRGRLEGSLVGRESAALEILADDQPTRVAMQDIVRLWVHGRAAKRGAVVGMIVGAVVGAGAGLFIGEVICNNPDCQTSTAKATVTLTLVGVGAGAGGGALIGLAIPWWHQRFP